MVKPSNMAMIAMWNMIMLSLDPELGKNIFIMFYQI